MIGYRYLAAGTKLTNKELLQTYREIVNITRSVNYIALTLYIYRDLLSIWLTLVMDTLTQHTNMAMR